MNERPKPGSGWDCLNVRKWVLTDARDHVNEFRLADEAIKGLNV